MSKATFTEMQQRKQGSLTSTNDSNKIDVYRKATRATTKATFIEKHQKQRSQTSNNDSNERDIYREGV